MAGVSDHRPAGRVMAMLILPSLLLAAAGIGVVIAHQEIPPAKLTYMQYFFVLQELPVGYLWSFLLLLALPLGARFSDARRERLLAWLGSHPAPLVAVFVFCAFGTLVIHHNHPLSMDEIAPFFQAQIFASGSVRGHFPPELVPWLVPDIFNRVFFSASPVNGEVVSGYWPGFALLLTPFVKLGVPWLLNPLLATAAVVLLRRVVRFALPEDPRAPGWATLFMLASPVFGAYGISYYSMNAHLCLNLLFADLLLHPATRGRLLLAGIVGSLALNLHNPLPHLCFALPWIFWLALRPGRFSNLGWLLLGYLPLVLLLGFGWWFGVKATILAKPVDPARMPVAPAFPVPQVAWLEALWRLARHIFSPPGWEVLQFRGMEFLRGCGWAVPGLPVLALLGVKAARHNRVVGLFAWSALVTLVGFGFFPHDQGHGWGMRYFHSAWMALPILAAAFLATLRDEEGNRWQRTVWVLALGTLLIGLPVRMWQIHDFIGDFLAQRPPLLAREGERQISFIALGHGFNMQDLIANDPELRNRVLYLVSRSSGENREMIERHFPEARFAVAQGLHSVWILPDIPRR